ncbi:alpha,alpha-trehalase TreF [Jiulongibacter sp. NS-SX5]|uniref:alpha,alpha-trehalase TreF n=1 Tax=Jiulongibacter sp. NS-SX5 TaxID=3463854 RepID=UPI00405A01E3
MRLKITGIIILFSAIAFSCGSPVKKKEFKSPEEMYPVLFEDIQLGGVFSDSKTFVDCVPKYSPEEILLRYTELKKDSAFVLAEFVEQHFEVPKVNESGYKSDLSLRADEHINKLWPVLTREPEDDGGTLIPLRKPYIVPGGRFGEIYYWDSYFTMLGLQVAGEDALIENMVVNFAQLIQDFGHIPNGNRSYYLSRSQPPFFAMMVELLADVKNDEQILVEFLPQMQKEYQYWMSATTKEEASNQNESRNAGEAAYKKVVFVDEDNVLNRYFDESATPRPEAYKEDIHTAELSGRNKEQVYRDLRSGAESGWDYTSRWLKDGIHMETIHTTEILPVDLNALLYHMEDVLEKTCRLAGKDQYADSYKALKEKRLAVFNEYFWDNESGFFVDYDFVAQEKSPHLSLAAVFPLVFEMASEEQAESVAHLIRHVFLKPGGLVSTLDETGQQWDSPNGWAPLQWLAIEGLRKYGYYQLANQIKANWVNNCLRVYQNTGKMVEKYNVCDLSLLAGGGEYPVQDGFGWTNGILLKLLSEETE